MSMNYRRIRNRIIQGQRRGLERREERVLRRSLDRERHRIRRHRISQIDIDTVYYLGQMNELCQYCESLRFSNEQRNCCHNGKVSLTQYPESLKELLMGSTQDSINFRNNIRNYNSAFASFGAIVDIPQGHGTYCFRIHGQTYHCTNTLYPNDGEELQYRQLYIIESSQAINRRYYQIVYVQMMLCKSWMKLVHMLLHISTCTKLSKKSKGLHVQKIEHQER